jgi:mRNA interferase RelE/StbE
MAWRIEFEQTAQRELKKLDPQTVKCILRFLNERLAPSDDPRRFGEALHGALGEYWKYRVGDYRIIATIEDEKLRILVVRIGNRRAVYR